MSDKLKQWLNPYVLITLIGVAATGLLTFAALSATVQQQGQKIDRLEEVQRADHDTITEMRTDVKWIRSRLGGGSGHGAGNGHDK